MGMSVLATFLSATVLSVAFLPKAVILVTGACAFVKDCLPCISQIWSILRGQRGWWWEWGEGGSGRRYILGEQIDVV